MFQKSITFFFLTLFFTCFSIPKSNAQILNVEKKRLDKADSDSSSYWINNAGINFSVNNRGGAPEAPVELLGLTANADIAFYTPKVSLVLLNHYNYFAVARNPIISFGYSHFRINYLRKNKVSYETYGQHQFDMARGLSSRNLAGAGTRFKLFNNKKLSLVLATGFMYEREVWEFPAQEELSATLALPKSSSYISKRVELTEHIDFNAITYFQTGYDPGISKFRHRVSCDANLLVKVTSKLSLKTTFQGAFENRPVVPIAKFIYAVTNGIQLNF
jgi:hypothetical protein